MLFIFLNLWKTFVLMVLTFWRNRSFLISIVLESGRSTMNVKRMELRLFEKGEVVIFNSYWFTKEILWSSFLDSGIVKKNCRKVLTSLGDSQILYIRMLKNGILKSWLKNCTSKWVTGNFWERTFSLEHTINLCSEIIWKLYRMSRRFW